MRVSLALMFFAPLAAALAVKNGAEQILPLMIGMSVIAVIAYFVFERKAR